MSLDPDLVAELALVLAGKVLRREEAERLAELLQTREEFLAWLYLRSGYFDTNPAVGEALRAAARQHVATPLSARPEQEDTRQAEARFAEREAAIKTVLDLDRRHADALVEAWQRLAAHDPTACQAAVSLGSRLGIVIR